MEFVWSDELALLLAEQDGTDRSRLAHWLSRPVAYRLPDGLTPLAFGRQLLERQDLPSERRVS